MGNPYDTASDRVSVLGPTLRFKGELSADEDLVIHGQVEGSIGPSPRVTIGPDAKVKADIRAGIVVVEGSVEGDLHGDSAVVVRDKATVRGNIEAPAVNIVEGASFNGSVSMTPARDARGKATDVGASDTEAATVKTGTND